MHAADSPVRPARRPKSTYFLTLLWLPRADDAARAEVWLNWRAALEGFIDRADRVLVGPNGD